MEGQPPQPPQFYRDTTATMSEALPPSIPNILNTTKEEEDAVKKTYERCKAQVLTFPHLDTTFPFYKHNYHPWYAPMWDVVGSMVASVHFKARPTDIVVATFPKSGTTWIKALVYATVNRQSTLSNPLASYNPHHCVPFLESQVYTPGNVLDIESLPDPRLLSTHIPYPSLPKSMIKSRSRVIYLWRDPKAVYNSWMHYRAKMLGPERAANDVAKYGSVELFGKLFGGWWDHVLGYWKSSNGSTKHSNVLFLKYEDMLRNPNEGVKKIGDFVGLPFGAAEERQGAVEKITEFCSLSNLKNLEVNKAGVTKFVGVDVDNNFFFRKGEADDWKNHLSCEVVQRIDEITREKLAGSGLVV